MQHRTTYLQLTSVNKLARWEYDVKLDIETAFLKRISVHWHSFTNNTALTT